MPVHKSSNGKYRIGSGKPIYRTRAAAERAYKGYKAKHGGKCPKGRKK
jgi:hypothetical protein